MVRVYGIDNNDVVRMYGSAEDRDNHHATKIDSRTALRTMAGVARKWVHDVQPKTYRGMTCESNIVYWYCRAIWALKHIDLQIND